MDRFTYLNNENTAYIDSLYEAYQQDPASVDYGWQKFFEGFDFGKGSEGAHAVAGSAETPPNHVLKEINVLNMINGYRSRGHLFTHTNPVRERRQYFPGKELETFGLSDADLDTVFNAGVEIGLGKATLRDIRQLLEDTYCQTIGAEYKYIRNPIKTKWFEDRMEKTRNQPSFSADEKKRILNKLNQAVVFENFLGTKFLGQKRFSLEGAEALIPALDSVIEKGSKLGIEEFTIGMAHRGRLNVLANIMGKSYKEIFSEFEGKNYDVNTVYGGDVKYHLGFSTDVETSNGKSVHLSLCPNPSHLETVDPVVEGQTRSKIDFKYNGDYNRIAPILIHGDASVAGQGIIYEVLQMEKLEGYRTGGTVHLVINNQIGFTTNYKDARSSTYCTDIAKTVLSPVFHVNGDDAEALAYTINLAMEYRQTFNEDVFIDILCYRRYGHNESDEPKFTQPVLYKAIEAHANPREIYLQKLLAQGDISADAAKEMEKTFRDLLQQQLNESKSEDRFTESKPMFAGAWDGLHIGSEKEVAAPTTTSVSTEELKAIGDKLTELPANKPLFKKIEKLFEDRRKMVNETHMFDWAMGELMAYGSLLKEGHPVRLSGEDVKRGTFSHRHAVITLPDTDEEYTPMDHLGAEAKFSIYNSLLSEYGVLGFEYGYALANPHALTIWEAQFGDFVNGAQIIVDQYITSAETKWQRGNGLVMLLPHGYEGQGPEHSSARIERFMELCADNNIQVANCTTPANFFHVLRRQLHRDFRKPLVVFTPKSLLRHPACVSPLADFTDGQFQEMIDDTFVDAKKVKRVLFCSGKIYYDLLEKQQTDNRKDVAVVRVEQLYPTPKDQMEKLKAKYSKADEFIWVQEEPENMGAWPYMLRKFRKSELQLDVISRKESASTATGYAKQHNSQQLYIIGKAFESPAVGAVKDTVKDTTKKMAETSAD
ncbi:2-oxoglutarate dehydrogenase E1 component [Mucilaginibacter polytrichastri]|uniref:oxoglutarate dehydrogenase (succinyl-transferring) n=1 Tax=Mucilaginibacter polytrichastri TaxID=1302689 RepID=A0A1Q6A1V1_9SPHI|nr:2-oxoglutarate dehydrogenase E1 component [Mucilaginibacter polytrichastri]OKS87942.1 2-oxoglutarate dehydrogenase E1 component [Mucilaginibacter polytrichastri]SFT23288.1 2-oxoglutarate dehydrogenase E1 component [Mucilaginibacter polytrichastri]